MPEGDTIHHAAGRLREVLEGHVPDAIATPQRRHAADRWPERLAGRTVTRVEAHGKHLFVHFDGDLVLHSHLRMTGAWAVYGSGARWRRAPRRAWLVITRDERDVVQFDGPVLELLTEHRRSTDLHLAALGPDIIGTRLDPAAVVRRFREDDPTRAFGDALLDQRTLAGIGNIWKSESCFATSIDPWRPLGTISDGEIIDVLGFARERMSQSARDGYEARPREVYGRRGEPCRRCGAAIRSAGQGEANRTTYWCRGCQH